MEITEIVKFDEEIANAIREMVPQLSGSASPPGDSHLEKIITGESTRMLVAKNDEEKIVGCLTLAIFPIPTGLRAWVEDVVVDESQRRLGVATALNLEALKIAKEINARTVDLTSRPTRESANNLYKKLGFKIRETNVYRYEIE